MGLLDDAIRDHLELKRRHGADPSEVARLEQEALGPARREPAEVAQPPSAPFDAEEHGAVVADREETPASPDDDEDDDGPEPLTPTQPAAEPEAPVVPPVERPAQGSATEGPEGSGRDEDTPEGADDVLQETPDFLQETPEHDRLWFEQKPPRDFDF